MYVPLTKYTSTAAFIYYMKVDKDKRVYTFSSFLTFNHLKIKIVSISIFLS